MDTVDTKWDAYRSMRFYKITNMNENHYGYQYVDGLNVLKEDFVEDGTCVAGGFYFTTLDHITEFYKYGINLREITLPFNNKDFRMVADPSGNKWRANRVILGKKYSLLDPEVYDTYTLKMTVGLLHKLIKNKKYHTLDHILTSYTDQMIDDLLNEYLSSYQFTVKMDYFID